MQINVITKMKLKPKCFLNDIPTKELKTIEIIKMFIKGLFNKKKDLFEIIFYDEKKNAKIVIQMVF